LVLYAFGLLYLDGHDLRRSKLVDRKAAMSTLLDATPRERIASVESMQGDGPELFRQRCKAGLEGIVSKRPNAPYRAGRADWLKCKCNIAETLIIGASRMAATRRAWANY
jgi:bifunctional non-homologous end joining protein LigD